MDDVLYSFMASLRSVGISRSVPLVDRAVAEFLHAVATTRGAYRALELGTGIGYTTLIIADGLGLSPSPSSPSYAFEELSHHSAYATYTAMSGCKGDLTADRARLVTIDRDVRRVVEASAVVSSCGLSDSVCVELGDVCQVLATLTEPFDLVFVDAGKSENRLYVEELERRGLLRPRCTLLVDNLNFAKGPASSRHIRIRDALQGFVSWMEARPEWQTLVLDIGDGVLLGRYYSLREDETA